MSDGSQVAWAYVEVPNFGEIPTSNPKLKEIPYSSDTIKQTNETKRSANVKGNGRANDLVRVGYEAAGDLNADFVYGDFDDFLQYCLRSPGWSSEVTLTDTGLSFQAADQSINRAAGDFVADGYTANGYVLISGAADAANNGFKKIATVAATKITLSGVPAVVTAAAGPSITVRQGGQIVDANTLTYIAGEREYRSNTADFARYAGIIGRMQLRTAVKNQMTVAFQFIGQKEESAAATFGDGANTAQSGNEVLNTVKHIVAILEAGVSHDLNSLNLTIDPKITGRTFMGNDGNTSVRKGDFEVTGDFEMLYKNSTGKVVADKGLNFTATNLVFVARDAAGNAYVFDLPQVQFGDVERVGGGNNTDVVLKVPFSGEESVAQDTVIRIVRFPAP